MPPTKNVSPQLSTLRTTLGSGLSSPRQLEMCKASERQLSFRVKSGQSVNAVYEYVVQALAKSAEHDFIVYCSTHSVDILTSDVSKVAVREQVEQMVGERQKAKRFEVLCVGDRGRFPGNDVMLLDTPFSLS